MPPCLVEQCLFLKKFVLFNCFFFLLILHINHIFLSFLTSHLSPSPSTSPLSPWERGKPPVGLNKGSTAHRVGAGLGSLPASQLDEVIKMLFFLFKPHSKEWAAEEWALGEQSGDAHLWGRLCRLVPPQWPLLAVRNTFDWLWDTNSLLVLSQNNM